MQNHTEINNRTVLLSEEDLELLNSEEMNEILNDNIRSEMNLDSELDMDKTNEPKEEDLDCKINFGF